MCQPRTMTVVVNGEEQERRVAAVQIYERQGLLGRPLDSVQGLEEPELRPGEEVFYVAGDMRPHIINTGGYD